MDNETRVEAAPADGQALIVQAQRRIKEAKAAGKLKVNRYDHGGGRVWIDGDKRELVVDVYEEDTRELVFALLGIK